MNVYVRDLTHQLGRMDIQVDVFTRSQDEHVPHVLHDLGYGNRVVHVLAGPEVPLPKRELASFVPEFVKGILDFTAQKGFAYDLIHSHYWMSGLAARELKSTWNTPVVHMFHTLGLMKQRVAQNSSEAEGDYRINGERQAIRVADRIVAATPAELAQLQWLYNVDIRKVEVIPPGVDISHFYPIPDDEAKEYIGIPPCEKMLLFVGRIEPLKGLDTLIEAISHMRQSDIRVCLTVIGGDPGASPETINSEMARLQSLCEKYSLKDLVAFLGKRGQATLPYYYSAAEAVVVPSHYESFGMVALEAMACGTPVVASQVGGLAFLVQDGVTGYTVPVNEPLALADRLTRLVNDPDLKQRMGENAAKLAREYRWENIATKILRVYQQTLHD
jgi:D-inositol-3-phosphate glycosyltransferase